MNIIMIICGYAATCVRRTAEFSQPCVKEAETNCQDVAIITIICVAISVIAIYAIRRYFIITVEEINIVTCGRRNSRVTGSRQSAIMHMPNDTKIYRTRVTVYATFNNRHAIVGTTVIDKDALQRPLPCLSRYATKAICHIWCYIIYWYDNRNFHDRAGHGKGILFSENFTPRIQLKK